MVDIIYKYLNENADNKSKKIVIIDIKKLYNISDKEANKIYNEWRKKYILGLKG